MPERPHQRLTASGRASAKARAFADEKRGCLEGRSATEWVDSDFIGHRIAMHLSHGIGPAKSKNERADGAAPMRHFSVISRMAGTLPNHSEVNEKVRRL